MLIRPLYTMEPLESRSNFQRSTTTPPATASRSRQSASGESAPKWDCTRRHVAGPKKLKEAIAKFSNYFLANHRRMQYASFKHLVLPCGSGCVESAIRRVINLRLKSAGSFWKRSTSEAMLFLRSTLLCDRWNIMLANLAALNRDGL